MKVDITHLEKLSKLEIAQEDKEKFASEFEKIVDFVDEIAKLDLPEEDEDEGVFIGDLREDEEEEEKQQFDPLLNAPKKKNGCYHTPLVVE